ncbi:hypothetical protein TNCV_2410391 [Trichonephila clavipes]|nr:hypothetical protein TNCV_2410391 [Trichonephila clavipes]
MEEEAEKFYIIKGLKENRSIEIWLQSCSNIEELKEKMRLLDIQGKSKSNRNEVIYPSFYHLLIITHDCRNDQLFCDSMLELSTPVKEPKKIIQYFNLIERENL